MKRKTLMALLLLSLVAAAPPSRARIRMGTLAPSGSGWHELLKEMAFRWKEASGGAVDLTIYAGGIVGGEDEMIRKMRVGQLQSAAISNAGLAEVDKAAYGLMLPMMFQTYEEWDYVRQRMNPILEERLRKEGFIVLCWSDVGWVYFFSAKPLTSPAQLMDRKLGASPTEAESVEIMKWARFNPVPISVADTATGLQTGLIDTVYMPLIFVQGSQFYRDAPNMTDLKWAPLQGALVMTEAGYESIPAEHREEILKIAREIGERLKTDTRRQEEDALKSMKERGLKVWPVDAAERAEWQRTAERAYQRIRGELVPVEIFDQVQALVQEYRASHSERAK